MRFGLMATQLDALIPANLSPQQLLLHLAGFDQSRLVSDLFLNGFNPIELGGDLELFFPGVYSTDRVAALAELQQVLGISYTVHLPLWSVEPASPLQPVRRGSVEAVAACIQATLPLQPEVYVLHAYGALATEFYRLALDPPAHNLVLRQFQNSAEQSLREILAKTGLPSRRLAVETVEFPLSLTIELAEALDLSICFDSGHVLVGFSGEVEFFDALERCLPRLAEIHLHDAPAWIHGAPLAYGKDHQSLGKGDLELARLLDRLVESGFQGPLVFELTLDQALQSLQRIHAVRPALLG